MKHPPKVGDDVLAADDLALGDLVCLEPASNAKTLIRKLSPSEARSWPGTVYRIEPSTAPGAVTLRVVHRGSQ